jgi:predicted  nucleic acid-binding Zn-ribbon protein|tara:strand:- start:418 stop:1125 length:708 start_codon:yes stop_codon:yes gene_type:complete
MNSIQDLIELQKIDSQLAEIEELLGDLPIKVTELKNKEDSLTSDFERGKARLKEIALEQHKTELNLAEFKEKIDKLKDQLFLVTNNKQYDALMLEIDHLKENLDRNETTELELLEEKDQLAEQVKSQEQSLESLSKELSSKQVNLEQALAASSSEKKDLESRRKETAKDLSASVLARYNRILSARNGLAVVSLEGRSCGGCGAALPPQLVAEVKTLMTIQNCSICTRFLFWEKPE